MDRFVCECCDKKTMPRGVLQTAVYIMLFRACMYMHVYTCTCICIVLYFSV